MNDLLRKTNRQKYKKYAESRKITKNYKKMKKVCGVLEKILFLRFG